MPCLVKQILEKSGLKGIAVDIAGYHHERLMAQVTRLQSKPLKLANLCVLASIVDVYDALTAERVYKAGHGANQSL